ncbi:MAG: hypothetical protein NVS1B5_02480 [Gemmatimonadaceae bacterium]
MAWNNVKPSSHRVIVTPHMQATVEISEQAVFTLARVHMHPVRRTSPYSGALDSTAEMVAKKFLYARGLDI